MFEFEAQGKILQNIMEGIDLVMMPKWRVGDTAASLIWPESQTPEASTGAVPTVQLPAPDA